jgi:hypothetical protein
MLNIRKRHLNGTQPVPATMRKRWPVVGELIALGLVHDTNGAGLTEAGFAVIAALGGSAERGGKETHKAAKPATAKEPNKR